MSITVFEDAFQKEDPEQLESNNRATDLLKRMNNVVEELHSRYADGFNNFGTEETGCVRLLLIIDELVNSETFDGNGFAFIQTTVSTVADDKGGQQGAAIYAPLKQVVERRVPSDLDAARLWIVYCLSTSASAQHSHGGSYSLLADSLEAMWKLGEVVDAFYKKSSPLFATKLPFRREMLHLMRRLQSPPGGGTLGFHLDIGALSAFHTLFRSQLLAAQQQQTQGAAAASSSSAHQQAIKRAESSGNLPVGGVSMASVDSNERDHVLQQQQHQTTIVTTTSAAGAGGRKKIVKKIIRRTGGGGDADHDGGGGNLDASSPAPSGGLSPMPSGIHNNHSSNAYGSGVPSNVASGVHVHHSAAAAAKTTTTMDSDAQVELLRLPTIDRAVQAVDAHSERAKDARSLEELAELDRALSEREAAIAQREQEVKQFKDTLKRREKEVQQSKEDYEQKLDNVAQVGTSLKQMFNDLFVASREAECGQRAKLRREEMNPLLEKLVAVLSGKDAADFSKTSAFSSHPPQPASPAVLPQQQQQLEQQQQKPAVVAVVITPPPTPDLRNAPPAPPLPSTSKSSQRVLGSGHGGFSLEEDDSNSYQREEADAVEHRRQQLLIEQQQEEQERKRKQQHQQQQEHAASSRPRAATAFVSNTSMTAASTNLQQQPNSARGSSTLHADPAAAAAATASNNTSAAASPERSTGFGSRGSSVIGRNDSDLGGVQNNMSFTAASLSALAAATPNRPQISSISGKPLIVLAPDTCTTRPSSGVPYIIDKFEEPERNMQLQRQRGRCPKCQCELTKNDVSNALLRSIVNMGQLALQQKPRRCHYSGEIFCQKCHTNKTALIPHRVCTLWDFEEYHVSDGWYDYLSNNFERPIIRLPDVPFVMQKPVAQQLSMFRRKLNRMHAILVLCPTVQKNPRSVFTTSYYFSRENWWSLADLVRMRLLEPDAPSALGRGVPNADLLQHLGRLMSEALDHINSCPSCRERGYGICTLCNEVGDDTKTAFWEDGTACPNCASIFHDSCFELRGCPKCREAAKQQQQQH